VTEGLLYQALVRRTPDLIGVTGERPPVWPA
jgi:hypothetical protein